MDLGVRRWLVVGAVVLSGAALTGRGAVAQEAPTSTTTTTTVPVDTSTTVVSPGSPGTPGEEPGPPDLRVELSYACPLSTGDGPPVTHLMLAIVNRGGTAEVDLVVNGVTVLAGIEVPQSFLGIPQQLLAPLPDGEPGTSVRLSVVASGTDLVLAQTGFDHWPRCDALPVGAPPPATPTRATPAYTG
jgi:hypothetical protein